MNQKEGSFECNYCHLNEAFHYFGKDPNPKWGRIEYKEQLYMLRNPFLPPNIKLQDANQPFLVIGGVCSECQKDFCVDPDCSLYFARRFCLECANKNLEVFPENVRGEVIKRLEARSKPRS